MVKKVSNSIVRKMIDRQAIMENEYELYDYGLQVIISSLVSFISAMAVGFVFQLSLAMFVFLICFALMRMYSGGYHAQSYLICYFELLALSVIIMITIKGMENLPVDLIKIFLTLFTIVSTLIIYAFAPVDHENAQLSEQEIPRYRRVVRRIYIFHLVIVAVLVVFLVPICIPIAIALAALTSSILVICGQLHRKAKGGVFI
ncbi:MAG: hypothetical protein EOM59_15410 [Clostridia bacterium]|nr:hypothetical protein [Clostridia bacterium]